jgi:hypothetical protein
MSSTTSVRAVSDGCSAKVANHRFTAVNPCYERTNLLRRVVYALGRSGEAGVMGLGSCRLCKNQNEIESRWLRVTVAAPSFLADRMGLRTPVSC